MLITVGSQVLHMQNSVQQTLSKNGCLHIQGLGATVLAHLPVRGGEASSNLQCRYLCLSSTEVSMVSMHTK